jgi:hypothetical protein
MTSGRSHTIRVADESWFTPVTIQISSPVASEAINDLGRFSCIVPAETAIGTNRDQWIGKWVRWEDESFGLWGGVIEAIDPRPDERTWELSCVGFGILLDWRVTPVRYTPQAAPAGALVSRAYSDASADLPTWVSTFVTDESGPPVLWDWRGESVLGTMRSLASQTLEEWFVTYVEDASGVRTATGVTAYWAREINLDGFNRPLIHEGTHQASIIAPLSGGEIINDLVAVGNDADMQRATRMRLRHPDSQDDYGTRQATRRYTDVTTPSALHWRGRRELEAFAKPAAPLTIDLARTCTIARQFKVGTIGYLMSATLDYHGQFRVLGRAVDIDAGILTLSGRRYP